VDRGCGQVEDDEEEEEDDDEEDEEAPKNHKRHTGNGASSVTLGAEKLKCREVSGTCFM
jgi:hypothetical protein